MTNEERRIKRIELISRTIKKYKSVKKEKLLALFMLDTGTSRRTTLEYINLLINSGMVEETNKTLRWIGE